MGVALMMTNSRGGVISVIAEILFLLVMSGFRKRKKQEVHEKSQRIKQAALRAALALSLVVALFAGVVLLGGESALSRFAGTVNSEDPTTGRAHFWNVTARHHQGKSDCRRRSGCFPDGLYALRFAEWCVSTGTGAQRLPSDHV